MTYLENDELFTWGTDPLSQLIDFSWLLMWMDLSVGLWCRLGFGPSILALLQSTGEHSRHAQVVLT